MLKNKKISCSEVLLILTILMICFIWGHSMMPADISSGESQWFLQRIQSVFNAVGIRSNITEHFVRKLAHFTEYACLGILLMLNTILAARGIFKNKIAQLYIGLLVPVIDESIQLFVEGRSGMITDVWIDYSGVIAGMAAVLWICIAVRKRS